jgi:hypothetical protein
VPSRILAYLNTHDKEDDPQPHLSLVRPATSAALSFFNDHMAPPMSNYANGLFSIYHPLTSRGSLVLLCRRQVHNKLSNLCVYDSITGHSTFVSNPPRISSQSGWFRRCVLLTAADGIGCPFSLFVPHLGATPDNSNTTRLQTAMYTHGT